MDTGVDERYDKTDDSQSCTSEETNTLYVNFKKDGKKREKRKRIHG